MEQTTIEKNNTHTSPSTESDIGKEEITGVFEKMKNKEAAGENKITNEA